MNLFLCNLILSEPFIFFFFPPNFLRVFPMLAVANAESCVSLQNKQGHRAHRHRRLMQVPVLSARGSWWLFSSLARILGKYSTIHSPPALFFLSQKLARAHLFHSLCEDQSTVAQRVETTVAECSLTCCVWVRFRICSYTMCGQRFSQPTPTSDFVRSLVCLIFCLFVCSDPTKPRIISRLQNMCYYAAYIVS